MRARVSLLRNRGGIPVAATVAVFADTTTTAAILASPAYVELNQVITWLAGVHLLVGVGAFAAYNLVWLSVAWLRLGWVSTAVGIYLAVVLGIGGTNNLLLFATGVSMLDLLGGVAAIHLLVPAVGATLALAGAVWHHAAIPRRELLAATALFLAMQGVVLVGWV